MGKSGELIHELISSKNETIYSVAKNCGIDRSLLSKYLNGKSSIDIEKFSTIVDYLKLNMEADALVRKNYLEEITNYRDFNGVLNALKLLTEYESLYTGNNSGSKIRVSLDFEDDVIKLNSRSEIASVLDYIIRDEATDSKRLYTNINSDILFDVMKNYPAKIMPGFDFRHIVDSHADPLQTNIVETLKFMLLGYSTNYFETEQSGPTANDALFPKYAIGNEVCLFVDNEIQTGYAVKNKSVTEIYVKKFLEVLKNTQAYSQSTEDILELKLTHLQFLNSNIPQYCTIDSLPASVFFMTKDMWHQIAKQNVQDRTYLIDTTFEYYQGFLSQITKYLTVLRIEGLRSFVDKGIVYQMPANYADPLTIENRMKVLESMKEYFEQPGHDFYLLKENVFHGNNLLNVEVINKGARHELSALMINLEKEKPDDHNYIGNFACNIFSQNEVTSFYEFMRALTVSGCCYTKTQSMLLLEEEILRCKYNLESQNKMGE